ncbi:hypothetical protein, partial [Mannheimia haemolytica]
MANDLVVVKANSLIEAS